MPSISPASQRVRGIRRPKPPAISHSPVIWTTWSGNGIMGGMMGRNFWAATRCTQPKTM